MSSVNEDNQMELDLKNDDVVDVEKDVITNHAENINVNSENGSNVEIKEGDEKDHIQENDKDETNVVNEVDLKDDEVTYENNKNEENKSSNRWADMCEDCDAPLGT